MSTNRRGTWGPKGKGPSGRNLCYCGCGREVPSGKRTTFDPDCYRRWCERHDPATQRRLVYARDHGVCALCGTDTEARKREASETAELWRWLARRHAEGLFGRDELPLLPWHKPGEPRAWSECWHWACRWVNEDIERTFGKGVLRCTHTWEADHIVPVVEGGGECDLSNLRTLCLACHRQETARLAARRAAARRACVAEQPRAGLSPALPALVPA